MPLPPPDAASVNDTDGYVLSGIASGDMLAALLAARAVVALSSIRDDDGVIVDFECVVVSPAVEQVVGVPADAIVGYRLRQAIPGAACRLARLAEAVETNQPLITEFDWWDGANHRVVEVDIRPVVLGGFDGVVVVLDDTTRERQMTASIGELRDRQRELELQALHDPLTGCANRLMVETRLEHAISRLDRHQGMLAVLFVDLDGFKEVNDTHGHASGDAVLIAVADRLRSHARPYDTVGRLGGDEFVVVCEDLEDQSDLDTIARRFLDACGEPIDIGGHDVRVTASIGVALAESTDTDAATLIAAADTAMYRAKTYGGGRVSFADDDAERRRIARHDIEVELAHAIAADRLHADFEPIVRAADGTVIGAQMTFSLAHDLHGRFDDTMLSEAAHRAGLASTLTDHLIDVAADHLAARAATATTCEFVIVTVDGDVLCEPGFVDRVRTALARRQVPTDALCVAIDGAYIARNPTDARVAIDELEQLGVRIVRDNLGAVGSPLTYFDAVPIDFVRLDRSLVAGIDDPACYELIVAIANAMKTTRRRAIAPAVDSAAHADQLRAVGIDLLHGRHITRTLAPHSAGTSLGIDVALAGDVRSGAEAEALPSLADPVVSRRGPD